LKDLGILSYFLGIEVKKCSDGIALTQDKYTSGILHHVGLQDCKPMRTPLVADEKYCSLMAILYLRKMLPPIVVLSALYII
jgi:hypothetical protein